MRISHRCTFTPKKVSLDLLADILVFSEWHPREMGVGLTLPFQKKSQPFFFCSFVCAKSLKCMQISNGFLLSREPELKTNIQLDATETVQAGLKLSWVPLTGLFEMGGILGQRPYLNFLLFIRDGSRQDRKTLQHPIHEAG